MRTAYSSTRSSLSYETIEWIFAHYVCIPTMFAGFHECDRNFHDRLHVYADLASLASLPDMSIFKMIRQAQQELQPGAWTALHWACAHNLREFVQDILVAQPGSMFDETRDRCTPLHVAAQHGHALVCQTLVAAGAPLQAKAMKGWGLAKNGKTPEDLAHQNGHSEVVHVLQGLNSATGTRCGTGDALDKARRDKRVIVRVQWLKVPLDSNVVTFFGAFHSLLRVDVATSHPPLDATGDVFEKFVEREGDSYLIEKFHPPTPENTGGIQLDLAATHRNPRIPHTKALQSCLATHD